VGIVALPARIEIQFLVFDVSHALLPNATYLSLGSVGSIGFSLCVELVLSATWGRPSFFVACPAALAARAPAEAGATQVFVERQSKSMWYCALVPAAPRLISALGGRARLRFETFGTSGTDPQTGSLDPAGKSACATGLPEAGVRVA
jgi:hypothetical protein